MSSSLLSQKKLKTGGPWWFIQLWAHLYFQSYTPNFHVLADNSFPDQTRRRIRYTSYSQTLYSLPGSKLTLNDALGWFNVFYWGLDNPIFFPYAASDSFENPITFRLDSFADDDKTRHLYSIMIRPCFLPVCMSTSNRIIKPGYESYEPIIAAWQLGLGQVPPHFFLHHLTESRADLLDLITRQKCYNIFDDLHIPIPVDLSFTFSTNGFRTWWSMWKDHIFRKALGPMLQQINAEYEAFEGEVFPPRTQHDLLFNFSLNCLSLLQQQDGPELEHDKLSFSYLPVAPIVLFYKNAPPTSKIILDRQPDCSRSAFKRNWVPQAAAPQAQVKARRVTTRRVQKEVVPSSLDHEASNINQVRIHSLNSSFLTTWSGIIVLLSLQVDIENTSSRGEQTQQENSSLDNLENLVRMVDTLVNLQDMYESIVPKSTINPSREKVYHIPDWFELSSPCDTLTSTFFLGFQLLRVALIWSCIHRLSPARRRWSTIATD
jgi:hypothetical protein